MSESILANPTPDDDGHFNYKGAQIPAAAFVNIDALDLDSLTYEQWKQIKDAQWYRTYAVGVEHDTAWQRFLDARPLWPTS